MPKYVVAPVSELTPGQRKIVDIAGRAIGIFNLGGEFFALRNRCPHQGGPLCTGRLAGFLQSSTPGVYDYSRPGEILRCPWHGWEFHVRTGQSWFDPRRTRVRSYEVSVTPGSVIVQVEPDEHDLPDDPDAPAPGLRKGPYLAERYEVSIEQDYLVVDVPD